MYNLCYAFLVFIWIFDILNFPQFEMLDTTYPINTLGWILIWLCLPSPNSK